MEAKDNRHIPATIEECGVFFDSEMPDIIKLREEFKEKFGSTEIFDYFYINLKNRIAKDTMKSMMDGQKFGNLIHEKVKASMVVIAGNQENA